MIERFRRIRAKPPSWAACRIPAITSEGALIGDYGVVFPARLLTLIRGMWEDMAGVPVSFSLVLPIVVSSRSRLCPRGWAGLVVIGDEAIATVPDAGAAAALRRVLYAVPAGLATDADLLRRELGIAEMLGPAALAYLDPALFRPPPGPPAVRVAGAGDSALEQFFRECDPADLGESGIGQITSPVFAICERSRIVAAAGYQDWPGQIAHLSVLTAVGARGRGLGRAAAAAAVSHALARGRLPQWRARQQASRRVARAIGFTELGSQVSIRLTSGTGATAGNQDQNSG